MKSRPAPIPPPIKTFEQFSMMSKEDYEKYIKELQLFVSQIRANHRWARRAAKLTPFQDNVKSLMDKDMTSREIDDELCACETRVSKAMVTVDRKIKDQATFRRIKL